MCVRNSLYLITIPFCKFNNIMGKIKYKKPMVIIDHWLFVFTKVTFSEILSLGVTFFLIL